MSYEAIRPDAVTRYAYTLDGDTISKEAVATVEWDRVGTHELCLINSNPCYEGVTNCYTVEVQPPVETFVEGVICPGTAYAISPDSSVTEAGVYSARLRTRSGCDSLVTYSLIEGALDTTIVAVDLCGGDTLRYNGDFFIGGESQLLRLVGEDGCDSTVLLTVNLVSCELRLTTTAEDVVCAGAANGQVAFTVENGAPPYEYQFIRLESGEVNSGEVVNRGLTEIIGELTAGTYVLNVMDDFGNEGGFVFEIMEPLPLGNTFSTLEPSCYDLADGQLGVSITGGVAPYGYGWNDGSQTARISDLVGGTYLVTVTDDNGCVLPDSFTLEAPDPLILDGLQVLDPECDDPSNGGFRLGGIGGGTPPYESSLFRNDSLVASGTTVENLRPGLYALKVQDVNGCREERSFVVALPDTASAEIIFDRELVDAGESVRLAARVLPGHTIDWLTDRPTEAFCTDCPVVSTGAIVQPTSFVLESISFDGCVARDTVTIRSVVRNNTYIPTAFSPNGDGVNDRFRVFAGPSIDRLESIDVFDRWGGLVYTMENVERTDLASSGWDGLLRGGSRASSGSYLYVARFRLVTGTVQSQRGVVHLLR